MDGYEDFADLIGHGREIELTYNGSEISFTNFRVGRELYIDNVLCHEAFENTEDFISFVGGYEIGGVTIKRIINERLYDGDCLVL